MRYVISRKQVVAGDGAKAGALTLLHGMPEEGSAGRHIEVEA
ncbi:hypothetical protein [Undibacterium crateris]|nr:hypothetical protein [Undibacterium crateris]